jgi:hypothetical protein
VNPGQIGSPWYFALLGFLCGVVGFRIGWRTGIAILLPVVQGIAGYLAFATAWIAHGPIVAAVSVGGWALGVTVVSVPQFRRRRERSDRCVLRAATYRDGMIDWLRTGRGPESRPGSTALAHARELLVYLAAALLSANLLGLILGAALLNYMNAYVACLLRSARRPLRVLLLAWNVWSVVRVAAYIALGAACAAPLALWLGRAAPRREVLLLVAAGATGVVLDLCLKLLLSRPCGRALAAAVDLDAASAGG